MFKFLDFSYCHRKPERSFFWKGKQLPVCARCTGIHIGYLSIFVLFTDIVYIPFWISVLLVLPTYLDGLIQALTRYESTNLVRITTGIFAGVGSMSILSIVGKIIGIYLLSIIN